MKIYTLVKTSIKNVTTCRQAEKMATRQNKIPSAEKDIKDPFI